MPLVGNTSCSLPVELWRKVLGFATEERATGDELLFHPKALPGQMLATKLAIVQVCALWHEIGSEFLWEYVGNKDQLQLMKLAEFLVNEHRQWDRVRRGWWIKGLYTRFNFGDCLDIFITSIVTILQCCPNLRCFMHIHDFNGPLPTSVITALADNCGTTLHRFQLDWGGVNIDDLMLLLGASPALQHLALGCTFAPLSFANTPSRRFQFHNLRSLQFGNSEDGMTRRFNCHLLEAATWVIPSLTTVSIDLDARTCLDEVTGFLENHGQKLTCLSLTESGRVGGMPIAWDKIFGLCPNLIELRLSANPFSDPNPHAPSGRLIGSQIASHLKRIQFSRWEFFPSATMEDVVAMHDSDENVSPSSQQQLATWMAKLDGYFDAIGEDATPVLEILQFDFQTGRLDLPPQCMRWWQKWLSTWSSKGVAVEGPQNDLLSS